MVSEKKAFVLAGIILAIFLIVVNIIMAFPFDNSGKKDDILVWTKAICNDNNYCLDVRITCINGNVVDVTPQSEGVYFSGGWRDPRPEEFRKELC
jgi:hypothetical protein